jgi:hypothetical protein
MSARNNHFGKSDVSFTLFRAVGEAHVKKRHHIFLSASSLAESHLAIVPGLGGCPKPEVQAPL